MKTRLTVLMVVILVTALAGVTFAQQDSQVPELKKFALIVAISDYADPGEVKAVSIRSKGFPDLNSKNDVPLIKATLMSQGFTENNIVVVEDKAASKAGLVEAIKQHLIGKVSQGDIAVFHYSGHGQQVLDDNGDEIDGLDEALVPFDAAPVWQPGINEAQYHLRDDELGDLFNELRQKLGEDGHLLAILDACSSGTATRGFGVSRGYHSPLVPEGHAFASASKDAVGRGLSLEDKPPKRGADFQLAPFALISAAHADQLNYEAFTADGKRVGSLSYAFSRAMAQSQPGLTYKELFGRIMIEMATIAPNQTPDIEGAMDQRVLLGTSKPVHTFFKVKSYEDETHATIDGGKLFGLMEECKVGLYPIGSDTAQTQPLSTGTITTAFALEASLVLDEPISKEEAMNANVYVTHQSFGKMGVRVQLDIEHKLRVKAKLEERIAALELVEIVTEFPDLVIELNNTYTRKKGPDLLVVTSAQDLVLYEAEVEKNDFEKIVDDVIQDEVLMCARAKFLRGLSFGNGVDQVKMKMVSFDRPNDTLGSSSFFVGERFAIELTNSGKDKVYVALIDIMPDNQIGMMIPHPGESKTVADYVIKPGQTIKVKTPYYVAPPVGRDVLKLVVSNQPVDFSNLILSKDASYRGSGSSDPLFQVLASSYRKGGVQARDPSSKGKPSSTVQVSTIILDILEAGSK